MATILKRDIGSPATRPTEDVGYWARGINIALGVWLFISGFMWEQPQGARVNSYVIGAAIALVAVWALFNEGARYLNTALSVWLVLSTVAVFKLTNAPLWNNVIVGIVVFALSLVGASTTRTLGTPGTPRAGP